MTILPRLVPDNYRSIFAFLDPDSQVMMAIACRPILILTPSSSGTYKSVREEYLERARLLHRKKLPQTSREIIPIDLYRHWFYRGRVIDIHWNAMSSWFNLYTVVNPLRKLYNKLGSNFGGPFSNVQCWLENLSFEHHKIDVEEPQRRDEPIITYLYDRGHDRYHDNFTKRWEIRTSEVEKIPLPGRRKKHNPSLTNDDKKAIREGLIYPLEELISEIEGSMKKARSPYGTIERVSKSITKTMKRIEKGRELYM